ncbi:MAG: hypothetical protein H7A33_08080 [Deltaproteobacteria bacterium]|nr:hypothetical protein [Deltaproteobacteria bacterium]
MVAIVKQRLVPSLVSNSDLVPVSKSDVIDYEIIDGVASPVVEGVLQAPQIKVSEHQAQPEVRDEFVQEGQDNFNYFQSLTKVDEKGLFHLQPGLKKAREKLAANDPVASRRDINTYLAKHGMRSRV